jgi:hypothetical protein
LERCDRSLKSPRDIGDAFASAAYLHRNHLPQGLAAFLAAKNFLPLVRGEFGLAAHLHAARLRPLAALACARLDKVALELCEAAQHGQHQPPV